MPTFDDFPTLARPAVITYPDDIWTDPDVVTLFEDQQSVEVQSTGSRGFWGVLNVTITAPETIADTVMNFLVAHRLRAIPFYFTHRKRGRILVRYWPDGNPPMLPYVRTISGAPGIGDVVQFDLPLRQEAGT